MARTVSGRTENPQGAWLPMYAALVAAVLAVCERAGIAPAMRWWWLPIAGLLAAFLSVMITFLQSATRGDGIARPLIHRPVVMIAAGGWAGWAAFDGWHTASVFALPAGVVALSALGAVCQMPPPFQRPAAVERIAPGLVDNSPLVPASAAWRGKRRPTWQQAIRHVLKIPAIVLSHVPWEADGDGLQLFVELPAEAGTTAAEIAAKMANLAAAARLPRGCAIQVTDTDTQGIVVLDVMLRNNLEDSVPPYREPVGEASITDSFPVLRVPRGQLLSICLRIRSMVIGGTTDSGKTTLLHRIIMFLARCTDTLIWIIDLNGGGVAEPWIGPWAEGRASAPVVDWVADNEAEAAVMVAVARAVAVDRKTNRRARARRRAANSAVLPVGPDLPAILLLTDEGGEVRQAAGIIGQFVGRGVTRLAQIGRAEGLRVIMSVLRGTADLTDKGLRTVAVIRLCLRMAEHGEYTHVLDANPGRADLGSAPGAGYLKTPEIPQPALGVTLNVDLAGIDAHAVECASLRPVLDADGIRAAAAVTRGDIANGRCDERWVDHPAFLDVDEGRGYSGRWDRYAGKLAELRGEDPPEVAAVPAQRRRVTAGGELVERMSAWAESLGADPSPAPAARVYQFPADGRAEAPAPGDGRGQVLRLLREAGPSGMSWGELERGATISKTRIAVLLQELRDSGQVARGGAGHVLSEYARMSG